MRIGEFSRFKRASLGTIFATVVLLLGAGPAQANSPGAGAFTGYEVPPASQTFTNMLTLCASFNASTADPLTQQLAMTGTFHGVVGTGTATFTRTSQYFANPEGTHSDGNCLSPAGVTGTVTINFGPYTCPGTAGNGTYTRRATSVYLLQFTGNCTDGTNTYATSVTFTGTQVPCPPIAGCVTVADPNAASLINGSYVQTG